MKGKILSIVNEYAASVVREECCKYKISEGEFRLGMTQRVVRVRHIVMRRLFNDGFSVPEISRAIGFDESTIIYVTNPNARARKIAYRKRHYAEHGASA